MSTIFHQNDKGHSIYIVVNGQVDLYRKNDQAVDQHFAELREGAFFGVHALMDENNLRSATARARTYVTLLKLTGKEILKEARTNQELENRLHKAAGMM